jgi:SAM-dependent methyltransferase
MAAPEGFKHALLEKACAPYRLAGSFAYHFARGKLRGDPVYRTILEQGLLSGRGRILDLGCGQGLLFAWLEAAEALSAPGIWPEAWPPAPKPVDTLGIELMAREVERARTALGDGAKFVQADIRSTDFPACDAVVILDVLHYMAPEHQREVLQRVRAALPPQGLLLLRVADVDGGLRFRYTQMIDRFVLSLRGHPSSRLHCRKIAEWRALLRECGFDSEPRPMSHGTPFANVLMIATAL